MALSFHLDHSFYRLSFLLPLRLFHIFLIFKTKSYSRFAFSVLFFHLWLFINLSNTHHHDRHYHRLRCLLKLLQRGDVSAEILQKNLHYAARVLEALYIDETK